ncbi:MAG TPA: hypothetical protein VF292_01295 [Rhodanobacteraceae bacterium]
MVRARNTKRPRRKSNRKKLKARLRVAQACRNAIRRSKAHRRAFV